MQILICFSPGNGVTKRNGLEATNIDRQYSSSGSGNTVRGFGEGISAASSAQAPTVSRQMYVYHKIKTPAAES
jgi:hypothetical protein